MNEGHPRSAPFWQPNLFWFCEKNTTPASRSNFYSRLSSWNWDPVYMNKSKSGLICVYVYVCACVCVFVCAHAPMCANVGGWCEGLESATKHRNRSQNHVRPLSGLWILCFDCTARPCSSQASGRDLENSRNAFQSVGSPGVQVSGNSPSYPGLRAVLFEQDFLHLTSVSLALVFIVTY